MNFIDLSSEGAIKYYGGVTHLMDGWVLKKHIINYFFMFGSGPVIFI